jgi:hypothetical protein
VRVHQDERAAASRVDRDQQLARCKPRRSDHYLVRAAQAGIRADMANLACRVDRIHVPSARLGRAGAAGGGDEGVPEPPHGVERERAVRDGRVGKPCEDRHGAVGRDAVDGVVGRVAVHVTRREAVSAGRQPAARLLDDVRHRRERPHRHALRPRRVDAVRRVLDVEELGSRPDDVGEPDAGVGVDARLERLRPGRRCARDRGHQQDKSDEPHDSGGARPHRGGRIGGVVLNEP